jgi:cysteine synthase A
MNNSYLQKIENLQNAFGKTPLVEVNFLYHNLPLKIYAKYEAFNFSGSIKDRIAIHILKHAYINRQLNENSIIVEATSGNTGIAFSALGRALNQQVVIFMPDWLSIERYKKMELLGAKVVKVSASEGGFLGAIAMARQFAKEHDNVFCPEQFTNPLNPQAHSQSLALEINSQLKSINQNITHFVAGVGTGGTIMGFHNYCLENKIDCKCYPMEPENSPTLTTGGKKIGKHRIQGISDEFIPEILKLDQLQEIISVDDGDAIVMAQKLNHRGLSVGISSGANFIGALKIILKELSLNLDSTNKNLDLNLLSNKKLPVITTIFCDSSFKYFSTDLCNNEPIKDNFLSPNIEIIDYRFIN